MKIAILTQPLGANYGGILQAYALQQYLKKLGHDPITINRIENKPKVWKRIYILARRFATTLIKRKKWIWPGRESDAMLRHMQKFVRENIALTDLIDSRGKIKSLKKSKFDAYVIGSDQVWRPKYSPCLDDFFLDFLGDEKEIKRIAYAASFGVDNWEFSPDQTKKYSALIKKFHAIAVREDSAVNLCKTYFDVSAIHLIDPTMLLSPLDYACLVGKDDVGCSDMGIFVYILDRMKSKEILACNVSSWLNLPIYNFMPYQDSSVKKRCTKSEPSPLPPPAAWLSGLMNAKFIITDSFHGCVFAIIFNKPFVAIGNDARGMARFTSLLKMFGLEDRLVFDENFVTKKLVLSQVDWRQVNEVLNVERIKAREFIQHAIGERD